MEQTALLALMGGVETALHHAGHAALERFRRRDFTVSAKGRQDLVSEVDRMTEASLRAQLLALLPGASFLGEEGGGDVGDFAWIVDPIDGTANFVRGVPHWCISAGLLHRGRPVLGVIYDPNLDETFAAVTQTGAWLNGQPITIAPPRPLAEATLGLGCNLRADIQRHAGIIAGLLAQDCMYRFTGSGALGLAWAAAGRTDGFWEECIMPWDVAAGLAICAAAGGWVSDYWTDECWRMGNSVLVAAPGLAPAFREIVGAA